MSELTKKQIRDVEYVLYNIDTILSNWTVYQHQSKNQSIFMDTFQATPENLLIAREIIHDKSLALLNMKSECLLIRYVCEKVLIGWD